MSLRNKIRDLKWKIKSYFKRPNRIEPRHLPYTNVDKVDLLPHVMFETFCQFYEREVLTMSPDWCIDFSTHRIDFGGQERGVDEVFEWLYNWWAFYQKQTNYLWAYYRDLSDNVEMFSGQTENPHLLSLNFKYKDKEKHDKLFRRYRKKELAQMKMLDDNLKTLVDLRHFMWT